MGARAKDPRQRPGWFQRNREGFVLTVAAMLTVSGGLYAWRQSARADDLAVDLATCQEAFLKLAAPRGESWRKLIRARQSDTQRSLASLEAAWDWSSHMPPPASPLSIKERIEDTRDRLGAQAGEDLLLPKALGMPASLPEEGEEELHQARHVAVPYLVEQLLQHEVKEILRLDSSAFRRASGHTIVCDIQVHAALPARTFTDLLDAWLEGDRRYQVAALTLRRGEGITPPIILEAALRVTFGVAEPVDPLAIKELPESPRATQRRASTPPTGNYAPTPTPPPSPGMPPPVHGNGAQYAP